MLRIDPVELAHGMEYEIEGEQGTRPEIEQQIGQGQDTEQEIEQINLDGKRSEQNLDENDDPLDPEVLEMLGKDPESEERAGKDLHNKIATQWQHFLLKGLTKDERTTILNAYLPPKNCPNLIPPKLNVEVHSALNEIERKKDIYSQSKQTQLSTCLAAIGAVLNSAMTHKEKCVRELVKPLSDAGRLLCDAHHKETLSRRYTIINSLNHKLRDSLRKTSVDDFLFGSGLTKHLESTKAISKSGYELKQNRNFVPSQVRMQQPRNTLNGRGMPQPSTSDGRTNPSYPSYWRPPPPAPLPQQRPPPLPTPPTSARGRRPQPSSSSRARNYRYRDRRQ